MTQSNPIPASGRAALDAAIAEARARLASLDDYADSLRHWPIDSPALTTDAAGTIAILVGHAAALATAAEAALWAAGERLARELDGNDAGEQPEPQASSVVQQGERGGR